VTLRVDILGSGHLAAAGGHRSGRTSLLRTLARALASCSDPSALQVVAIDLGSALGELSALPHTSAVVDATDTDALTHVLDELAVSVATRLRTGTDDLHGDARLLLLVDDAGRLRRGHPDADDRLVELATAGPRARLHVAIAASR